MVKNTTHIWMVTHYRHTDLLDASRMKRVCIVVCKRVAREAKKANVCSCNWKKVPMMEKAA